MTLINQYFSADHDRLDCLYDGFKQQLAKNGEQTADYFQAFAKGLVQHIAWEEQQLFPFFEQKTGMTQGPTHVMRMEHEMIKQILTRVEQNLAQQQAIASEDLNELEAILREHNAKEEQILYPMIDRQCSAQDLAQLMLAIS